MCKENRYLRNKKIIWKNMTIWSYTANIFRRHNIFRWTDEIMEAGNQSRTPARLAADSFASFLGSLLWCTWLLASVVKCSPKNYLWSYLSSYGAIAVVLVWKKQFSYFFIHFWGLLLCVCSRSLAKFPLLSLLVILDNWLVGNSCLFTLYSCKINFFCW